MLSKTEEIKRLESLLQGFTVEGLRLGAPGLSREWVSQRIAALQEGVRLSPIQREALRLLEEENLGTVLIPGFGFVWPTNLRNDYGRFGQANAEVASGLVVEKLTADREDQ